VGLLSSCMTTLITVYGEGFRQLVLTPLRAGLTGSLPLITISIVRTISFTIYTSTKRIVNSIPGPSTVPGASEPNPNAPWLDLRLGWFTQDTARDVALTSLIAGGASGAVVCVGSAPFELVKVRRQLEYQIYRDSHPQLFAPKIAGSAPPPSSAHIQHPSGTGASAFHHHMPNATSPSVASTMPRRPAPFVPPTTMQAVRMIIAKAGIQGLYTGWRLHFIRDTAGTALYFAEYDVMRYLLGRKRNTELYNSGGKGKGREDEQGEVPEWAKGWLPKGVIPFVCGSLAGVTSWALIYPVDVSLPSCTERTELTTGDKGQSIVFIQTRGCRQSEEMANRERWDRSRAKLTDRRKRNKEHYQAQNRGPL